MSDLSPQAEARDVELATTKGRPHVAARGRTMCAPTEDVDHVGCGLPGAPYLPPGGKARAARPGGRAPRRRSALKKFSILHFQFLIPHSQFYLLSPFSQKESFL